MKYLNPSSLAKARHFMQHQARPLEQAIYEYAFESGSDKKVLRELSAFQNQDGGFGHGLEPDLRCKESSALATSRALEMMGLLPLSDERGEMVQRALAYFVHSYREERRGWDIIPPEAENAPRAVWWKYGVFAENWGNPNADILAFFLDHRLSFSYEKLDELVHFAIDYFLHVCDLQEMHELFCYVHLLERLDEPQRALLIPKMHLFLDHCIATDPLQREGYGAEPLQVADSPTSRYYEKYASVIPEELDKLIDSQGEDGAWAPNWTWFQYEEEWKQAKQEWKGILTLQALRTLQHYDRLNLSRGGVWL